MVTEKHLFFAWVLSNTFSASIKYIYKTMKLHQICCFNFIRCETIFVPSQWSPLLSVDNLFLTSQSYKEVRAQIGWFVLGDKPTFERSQEPLSQKCRCASGNLPVPVEVKSCLSPFTRPHWPYEPPRMAVLSSSPSCHFATLRTARAESEEDFQMSLAFLPN